MKVAKGVPARVILAGKALRQSFNRPESYCYRGFDEDGPSNLEPGTIFDVSLPILRTAEVLRHAANLARALGRDAYTTIRFQARYSGLEGRELLSWAKPRNPVVFRRTAPRAQRASICRSRLVCSW